MNLGGPATILPDATMYQTDDAENAAQAHCVAAAKSFDRRLAAFISANVDFAVDSTFDNPLTWTEFVEDAGFLVISEALATKMPQTPTKVNAVVPAYLPHLPTLITEANYPEWQAWILISKLLACANYLSDNSRQLAGQYDRFWLDSLSLKLGKSMRLGLPTTILMMQLLSTMARLILARMRKRILPR